MWPQEWARQAPGWQGKEREGPESLRCVQADEPMSGEWAPTSWVKTGV